MPADAYAYLHLAGRPRLRAGAGDGGDRRPAAAALPGCRRGDRRRGRPARGAGAAGEHRAVARRRGRARGGARWGRRAVAARCSSPSGTAAGASSFASRLGGGAGEAVRYRGVELTTYSGGLTTALHEDFLLLGSSFVVRSAIDAAASGDSLAADAAAERVRLELPDSRLADLYVSEAGAEVLLEGRGRAQRPARHLRRPRCDRGDRRRARGPGRRARASRSSRCSTPSARPSSPASSRPSRASSRRRREALGPDTLAMLDFSDPSQTVRDLLDQASAASPSLADAFDRLAAGLRRGGVDLEGGLLPLLRGEAAVAFAAPRGAAAGDSRGDRGRRGGDPAGGRAAAGPADRGDQPRSDRAGPGVHGDARSPA